MARHCCDGHLALGGALLSHVGGESSGRWGYQAAGTGILLFGMGNALTSLSSDNINKYWMSSFACYAVAIRAGLDVGMFADVLITEATEYDLIGEVAGMEIASDVDVPTREERRKLQ